jgi:hypothetical protein
MTDIIHPGDGLLFMKVGTHARESLDDIIRRKTKEIEDAGFGMWGYGGNTCHPTSMVQPFAEQFTSGGRKIFLCMQPMESRHFAAPACAAQYSADGIGWTDIPEAINVRGSRWALMIDSLEAKEFDLPLNQTRVPVGPSQGKLGSRYIRGQVDKACLEFLPTPEMTNEEEVRSAQIGLVSGLRAPFAVFLRGER